MRFTVSELVGFATLATGSGRHPGLSCVVQDRAFNYAIMAIFRSEDYGGGSNRAFRQSKVRRLAREKALELEHEYAA